MYNTANYDTSQLIDLLFLGVLKPGRFYTGKDGLTVGIDGLTLNILGGDHPRYHDVIDFLALQSGGIAPGIDWMAGEA